jgi:NDP-sugar pyrophosphorylase family protein
MKALIVAAGLGTRLKPMTDSMPKALIPLNGIPLLEHICKKLIAAGFDEIIINVHHFADQIINFIAKEKQFGVRIEISDERHNLLDTGGAIKKVSWFFNDNRPFLVHNVDVISDVNLNELYQFHLREQVAATLLVNKRETARYLLFDKASRLKAWTNIKTKEVKTSFSEIDMQALSMVAFDGIQVISPILLKQMRSWPDRFSIIDFYLSVATKYPISAYEPQEMTWFDVGKPETIHIAETWLKILL